MKRALLVISGGVLLALVADRVFRRLVQDKVYARTLAFAEEAPAAALLANSEAATQRGGPGEEGLDAPRPFEEIQPFDEEADNWGLSFSGFGSGGATLFDANGDGGLDLYVARDGRTWSRPTDEDGVLSDERRYQEYTLLSKGPDGELQENRDIRLCVSPSPRQSE